jgi:hypothetical protein
VRGTARGITYVTPPSAQRLHVQSRRCILLASLPLARGHPTPAAPDPRCPRRHPRSCAHIGRHGAAHVGGEIGTTFVHVGERLL